MNLSIRQRSNIRHFIYYLVNGTLDYDLLNNFFNDHYHDYLRSHPDLFYKTSCVFINQEVRNNPFWPEVSRLAEFICKAADPKKGKDLPNFESWELNFQIDVLDLAGSFKAFTKWYIESEVVEGFSYIDYVENGASFVEQCFAIWANVIAFKEEQAVNFDLAISRVIEYIKSYFDPNYKGNLELWELELHME